MGRPQFLEEWIDGATICRESSAVGFVWSLYEGCLHFFAKLVPLVSKRPSTASAKAVLNEEVGRLLSWGDGFENGELDRALERDPELKSTALEYLSSLGALLANKLFMVSTFTDVKGRSELEAKADELRSLVHYAKTIIDESEDDESDLESETGARSSNKKAMLDEVASDIKFYNLRLMDLLPSIERTALQPKDAAESKNDSNSIASVPFQVSKPAHAYVLQVRDKFPIAENKLIERLGQANWERRKRLQEDQVEFSETAVSEPAKSVFVPVSMFHDSGLGSSIPAVSAYAPTAVSHSSFRTSAIESQVGSYRVPPTPNEVFDGKPFTCEICGHVLKKIKNRVDWKIHVFADLKPYICTSSSCPDELSTFPTRQMWADHEFRKHRVEKSWNCYLCPAHLSSPGLWDDHIKQIHGAILSPEEHQKAISMAEISKPMPIESQTCPMCLKVGMKTRKEFVTHVAKHMENISLAALPRDADSDSGSDFERGSNSIEREDSVRTRRSSSLSLVNERFLTGDYEVEPYRIKCICGFSDDDGNTIFCEKCDTRQHIDCFYHGNVEEASRDDFNHLCADCKPRLLDRQSATKRQRIRREEDKPVKIRDKKNTKRRPSISQNTSSDSDSDREDETPKSLAPTATIIAPTGPCNAAPQRNPSFSSFFPPARRAKMRKSFNPLPAGWFAAMDGSGKTYYYDKSGQTTWQRPHLPAAEPPPPPNVPPKAIQDQKALQDIVDSLTKSDSNADTPPAGTPQHSEDPSKEKKKSAEKWRSLSQEKQMKLYENTLFPHIKYVMDKFRNKLPKEYLNKFAKEIGKKLVASDFKHNRVEDPTKITDKQEKKVKKYVKEFFDKAVAKFVSSPASNETTKSLHDSADDESDLSDVPDLEGWPAATFPNLKVATTNSSRDGIAGNT